MFSGFRIPVFSFVWFEQPTQSVSFYQNHTTGCSLVNAPKTFVNISGYRPLRKLWDVNFFHWLSDILEYVFKTEQKWIYIYGWQLSLKLLNTWKHEIIHAKIKKVWVLFLFSLPFFTIKDLIANFLHCIKWSYLAFFNFSMYLTILKTVVNRKYKSIFVLF